MTIKRYKSEKDNTIVNALKENLTSRGTKGNMGASDILEIFSIFGQASTSSLEQARILVQFPIETISSDRDEGRIPESGSATFKVRMSNAPHGQTTPKNYTLLAHPLVRQWTEGDGLDMESYLDIQASNWLSSSENTTWHTTGSDYATSSYLNADVVPIEYSQLFQTGLEGLDIDITGLTEEWIKHHKGSKTAASASINLLQNPTSGNTKAKGSITVTGNPSDKGTFTLRDTATSQVFIINTDDDDFDGTTNDGSGRTPIGIQGVLHNNDNIAERIKVAINGQTTVAITATRVLDKIILEQDVVGSKGNKEVTLSEDLSNVTKSNFLGGLDDQVISISSHEGEEYTYTFITSSFHSLGNKMYVELSGTAEATAAALKNRIDADFGGKIETGGSGAILSLTQSVSGLHGNTIISSSIPSATASIVSDFVGGTGMPNYGIVIKLRDDYTDGSKQRSYYTKKFYSRSSHEFFLRPQIEVQWDNSISDDRNYVIKSSSLAPASDNLNSIYHYNYFRGRLVDIPDTGSNVIVRFYPTLGGNQASVVQEDGTTSGFVIASKSSQGVYKAVFAYPGSETTLNDVWLRSQDGAETILATGSGFTVHTDEVDTSYPISDYVVNITNLKPSYLQSEKATFRVYTRNKNWQPNIYTVASQAAPVNTIRELFYKIVKISDNYEVISYSTSSSPSYSKMSYDKDGSYFDLDMALLEKNNAYQISFVFKDGANYTELSDKFRFRVDP